MAANYEILKKSEQELFELFDRFIKHVMKTWKIFNDRLELGKFSKRDLARIYEMEERANRFENEIMDECIWTISKDQPVASHLRYIISLLSSASDLERIADHIVSVAKWFEYHPKSDKDIRDLLIKICNESQKVCEQMLSIISQKNKTEIYEQTIELQKEYRKQYSETMVGVSKILKQKSAEEISNLLTGFLINFKHMERNVDHVTNVLENFIYIRKSDFFLNKQSKQVSKKPKPAKKPTSKKRKPTNKKKTLK